MNRRGHIPTMLLFVVGLVLVLSAWWTFLSFGGDVDFRAGTLSGVIVNLDFKHEYVVNSFERIVENSIALADKSNFKESFSAALREQVSEEDRLSDFGNFFGKIKTGDFDIVPGNGVYTLTVEDIFVDSKVDNHELRRGFDLSIRFSENGIVK